MPGGTARILQFIDPAKVDQADTPPFSAQERAILDRINQRVAAGESLSAIMDFFFDAGLTICPCDRIGLAFVEEDGRRVVSYWSRALYEPMLLTKGYAEDLRGSSLAAVRKTGRLRIINDLDAYLRRKPNSASSALLVREGVRSSMTCPLTVDGRNVGFLFRSSRRAFAYGMREVFLHQAVAERLSQAVEKAYRLEQLEAANRAYTEVLGFVSHELRSPLAGIVMDGQLLADGYLGPLATRQQDRVAAVIRKANYLLGLVNEYLDLARIESANVPLTARAVDFVKDVLDPACDVTRSAFEAGRVTLERAGVPDTLPVECDPALMQIVAVNLLGNAAKYGRPDGRARVTVTSDGVFLNVAVWNEGPGFPESERPRLFRRFSRLQTPELLARKGTGVGLYTSWRIVHLHGGTIHAESQPGQWAEFSFQIPLTQDGGVSRQDPPDPSV